ncbi:MAG TPA: NAD(P)/FAD-dependent oxidoreductase [Candidatus Acidoferrales bacterium]|nr:NAD(P)/FAD-dependent oxidoreductase [Candidatus Acidoferrales bacterium]
MDACSVLIVGGGPAGSSCAWQLCRAGIDVAILDKATFPRNKICGGWITLPVFDELAIDAADYARANVLQPITGFRTSMMGDRETETDYHEPISYGIRRSEFDDYLLKRSGARLIEGTPLSSIERTGDEWLVNARIKDRQIKTQLIIGAGGHFCPVARFLGSKSTVENAVAAQETEFEMNAEQQSKCSIRAEIPELYFCADMRGYGWCFRKGDFINIGLGRLDKHSLGAHITAFIEFLRRTKKITFDLHSKLFGHAYLLYGRSNRKIVDNGILLIGDAAGMAYSQSGEGIRPAIESGLLAAKAITEVQGSYRRENLYRYRTLLTNRFGSLHDDWSVQIGRRLPPPLMNSLGRALLATKWFSRHIVLDSWFLHANEPAFHLAT